jgi:hypothetical protein
MGLFCGLAFVLGLSSPGFEGGQMPLYRRMPKLVGRPMGPGHVRANYGLLKIDVLNKCAPNSEVTYETCLEQGFMTKVSAVPTRARQCNYLVFVVCDRLRWRSSRLSVLRDKARKHVHQFFPLVLRTRPPPG